MLAGYGLLSLRKGYDRDLRITRKAVSISPGARSGGIRGNSPVQNKRNELFLYPAPVSMPWDSSREE